LMQAAGSVASAQGQELAIRVSAQPLARGDE
jgi:hypothetical protein